MSQSEVEFKPHDEMRLVQVSERKSLRCENGDHRTVTERLTVEAALHVRINGLPFTTTMRTPGDDWMLIRGLLFTENIVSSLHAPLSYVVSNEPESGTPACYDVRVPEEFISGKFESRRSLNATSSCGICGVRSPSDIQLYGPRISLDSSERLDVGRIPDMMNRMARQQPTHLVSGGAHAAAAFRLNGELLAVFEDVGRHNAVDKAIGALIEMHRLSEAKCLCVSGRISYEIVYKAYRAGIPFLAAVSAPTSLAVETAERFGMTLLGFCRGENCTVYTNPTRITGCQ